MFKAYHKNIKKPGCLMESGAMIRILKKSAPLIVLSVIAMAGISFAEDFPAPQGWRTPAKDETDDGWRDVSGNRYLDVKGDFNGDGVPDAARILVSPDGGEVGLFAFIGRKDNTFEGLLLEKVSSPKAIRRMGIDGVHRDLYKTACGKGYRECKKDETPEIEIKNDSIDLFANEGAYSYFYWDEDNKNFKKVWISD